MRTRPNWPIALSDDISANVYTFSGGVVSFPGDVLLPLSFKWHSETITTQSKEISIMSTINAAIRTLSSESFLAELNPYLLQAEILSAVLLGIGM